MVNVLDVPAQLTPPLVKVGVTVIVAVTDALEHQAHLPSLFIQQQQ